MTADQIDTSTPEGLSAGLKRAGLSVPRFALLIGAPERTVTKWLKGISPVHPTAAIMLDWMLEGYRPHGWHMTGDHFRRDRERLGLSQDELADILDVETEMVVRWESDFDGPPGFVARAMAWLTSERPPVDLATDDPAAASS